MRTIVMAGMLLVTSLPAQRLYLVTEDPGPMKALGAVLERHGYRTAVESEQEFLAHKNESSPKAIFVYVHKPLEAAMEDYLISYAEDGGRLIILHHGIASSKVNNKRWLPFLGIRISREVEPKWLVLRGAYQLVNLNPRHYVTSHNVIYPASVSYTPTDAPSTEQQVQAIEIPDTEIFLNQVFTDGRRKTVLFGFKTTIDGKTYMQDRAGWTVETGKGHVFYFQPGHFGRDFDNPGYAQVLVNAIEWKPDSQR